MNDLPVVDAHLHLWDPTYLHYPWLDEFPQLNRPFLPRDYSEACGQLQVDKMVFLQCECIPAEFKEEVRWITSLAQKDSRIQGIVAGASLEEGEMVQPFLEELSENSLVKGVRRVIESEEDPGFCVQPDFIKRIQLLEKLRLQF